MLKFVLCDDNEIILERLSKILESLFIKHNIDAEISFTSVNPTDILDYVKNNPTTALFLDIDFKSDFSGLDLAEKIREINKNAYIIFTSAHLEYILMAYKYKTFDFIPKPITPERLEETLLRIIEDIAIDSNKTKYLKINKNTILLEESINYIKRDGMKLIFYTDNKQYESYNSFSKLEKELPFNFVRCHKSYIVNINKITNIDKSKNILFFNNNESTYCYIGPKYKNKLMEMINYDRNTTNNLDKSNYRK